MRAVFLDRDGVLNEPLVREGKPYAPLRLEDFQLIAGVAEPLRELKKKGFALIVVTNQPDVGRGIVPRETVEAMHQRLQETLPIDEVVACFDDGYQVDSALRKPNPGMILEAAKRRGVSLRQSYVVGDRWKDVEAGKRAGCKTVFIDYQYREELKSIPDVCVKNVFEAVKWILQDSSEATETMAVT